MTSMYEYSPEQLETLLTAFLDDLESIGFQVELGNISIFDKLMIVMPIWHQHRAQIAAARGPTSMAANLM